MLENFEVIFCSTIFIVPGYILYSTLESQVPRSKNNLANSTIKFLTATLAHYILWSWLILLMLNEKWYENKALCFWICCFIIIFVSPYIIGLIIVKLNKHKIVAKFLQRLGYNPINPIPTSWDYYFSNIPTKSWVIVTLNSGKVFYGKFSTNSFASSDNNERDLYIEDVFRLDDNENWLRREQNKGVLISKDAIQSIEFFNNCGGSDEHKEE